MLMYSCKLRRVIEKTWAMGTQKLERIQGILAEPSTRSSVLGIPSAEDLRHMMEDE